MASLWPMKRTTGIVRTLTDLTETVKTSSLSSNSGRLVNPVVVAAEVAAVVEAAVVVVPVAALALVLELELELGLELELEPEPEPEPEPE